METTHSTTGLSICIKFDMTLIFMFQDESEGEEEEALEVKEEAEPKAEDKKQEKLMTEKIYQMGLVVYNSVLWIRCPSEDSRHFETEGKE